MQLRSVNLGDIVTWDGCDWIVDAHGERGTRLNPVAGGSPVWVDLATISQDESFEHHRADTEHARAARNRVELAMLASEVRQDVLFWLQHVNEVQSGLIDPHDPDAQPRDGYGPETTLEERVQRKLAELDAAGIKTSRPSLFRKVAKYRTEGIAGLVDRRLLRRQEPRRIAPEIEEAAQRVVADHLGATSRDVLYFIDKVKHRVRQDNPGKDVNWPSDRTIRRWLTPMLEAAGDAMHLLDAEPAHLAPYADILLTMTGGKIGDLRSILALAMANAITDRDDTGSEIITQEHLVGVGQIGVA
ncbi:hypothetical protein ACWDUN_06555 [Mycobacterium sp. NPDC003323]